MSRSGLADWQRRKFSLRLRLRSGFAAVFLVGLCLENAGKSGRGLVEHANQLGSRRLENTKQCCQQNVARRKIGNGLDLLGRDDETIDNAGADSGFLELGREGLENLGCRGDILVTDDDGGLPL